MYIDKMAKYYMFVDKIIEYKMTVDKMTLEEICYACR